MTSEEITLLKARLKRLTTGPAWNKPARQAECQAIRLKIAELESKPPPTVARVEALELKGEQG